MSAPRFRIVPRGGLPAVVNFTRVDGATVSAFSDEARTVGVALPTTVTVDTTFYFARSGRFIPSVKVGGYEVAGTVDYPIGDGSTAMFEVPVDGASVARMTEAIDASTELGYAERTSNDTTTNTSTTAISGNKIGGLLVPNIIGQGLPVFVEFYTAGMYHSVAASAVEAVLVINGALAGGQVAVAASPANGYGNAITMRRRLVLTAGVSYTFEVFKVLASAGTGTYMGDPGYPMHLAVTR